MDDTHINSHLTPRTVITVYSDKKEDNFYLEQRDVKTVNGKYAILAAVPLAEEVLQGIAKAYAKTSTADMELGGWVASHLLYGENKPGKIVVIWYRPQMQRGLNFSASLRFKEASDVSIPATLYVMLNGKLYIYALMTDQRPTLSTKLYRAPFFNIYGDGNVCLGTAKIGKQKAKTYELEAERYERGFFMAEQSGGQSLNNCKTPLSKLWPALINNKAPFPSKAELVQHSTYKTFGTLLSKLIGNNSINED